MPRMTTRERKAARAERLREWAAKRAAAQPALNDAADPSEAGTGIPFGQPILVGHHSERRHRNAIKRLDRAMATSVENHRMTESMNSRADEIDRQADNAIYSDDPDAIEQLQAKIAGLEAERSRIKAYNATCRKRAKTPLEDLTEEEKAQWQTDIKAAGLTKRELDGLLSTIRVQAYQCPGGRFPSYTVSSITARISTARKRIAQLEREKTHGVPDRVITARYGGACEDCGTQLEKGELIRYSRQAGARCHPTCPP